MAIHRVKASSFYRIAIGTTAENNYSDGSRKYFDKCEEVLSMEMECPVTIITPFIGLTKVDVIKRSRPETLGLSFSCVAPIGNDHCGMCIKCQKKRLAFREAGLPDPTRYFS